MLSSRVLIPWNQRQLLLVTLLFAFQGTRALNSSALLQDLNDDISTWNRLKRDAGYYTEDGRWRGGLFLRARNEWFDSFTCNHLNSSYCHSWTVVKLARQDAFNGTCFCTRRQSHPYCGAWECSETDSSRRIRCNADGGNCRSRSRSSGILTSCSCLTPSFSKEYCLEWGCQRRRLDGRNREQNYQCIKEDATGNYCFRWNSSFTSDSEVRSSVCECFERGSLFCHHWRCKERKVRVCDAHSGQWCNLWLAIVVAGPLGALTIVALVIIRPALEESIVKNVYIVLRALLISCAWLLGVLIWGGVRGLPWVAAMWFVSILALILYIIHRNKRKYGYNIWIKTISHASTTESRSPELSQA